WPERSFPASAPAIETGGTDTERVLGGLEPEGFGSLSSLAPASLDLDASMQPISGSSAEDRPAALSESATVSLGSVTSWAVARNKSSSGLPGVASAAELALDSSRPLSSRLASVRSALSGVNEGGSGIGT